MSQTFPGSSVSFLTPHEVSGLETVMDLTLQSSIFPEGSGQGDTLVSYPRDGRGEGLCKDLRISTQRVRVRVGRPPGLFQGKEETTGIGLIVP